MINVRAERERLGWSQLELANKLGVSQQQVCKFEAPDWDGRVSTVRRIAAVMGLRVVVLPDC